MEKIYSKFVKERKKEFQIETALWKDENTKKVTKSPLYAEGEAHIHQIYETYKLYEKKDLLCGLEWKKDRVIFEFVEGITLEDLLLDAIKNGNREKVSQIIQQYHTILNHICIEKEVISSNNTEFSEVFGEVQYETEGYKNAIFDLTFDNIICKEEKFRIIDYEWRFSFAVEKDFIQFRAVYAFLMKYSNFVSQYYTATEFYELFGLDIELEKRYLQYNEKFIEYVYGKQGYQQILAQYKKRSMNVVDYRSLELLKKYDDFKTGKIKENYEDKIYDVLQDYIAHNQELYDDCRKFFKVTDKVKKQQQMGYLFSKEFFEEFSSYIKAEYDMLHYYKNESEKRKEIVEELSKELQTKSKQYQELEEKNRFDCELLTSKISQLEQEYHQNCENLSNEIQKLQEKLQYIQSCKAYKILIQKKVEERFE